ncbi:MAG: biotin/lipoyl-binding protein, partial [Stigonema ocellatum SAG 48.90 = DSM 106950]|nr:biotin/lipoyl-binding protein [Stigonema ocellatum SAG 48.90 = DSM 106950]
MVSETTLEFLSPVQNDEFLPPISNWTRLGGFVLIGTVGAAVNLAAVIKYNVTVDAAATVRPVGEIRLVQAANGGTVTNILVKENQVVKKGQTIALIDPFQLQ